MSELKPALITFITKHEEFLFLGKEYPFVNPDFKKIWDDFLGTGGSENGAYDIISTYQNKPCKNMNVWHNNNPEHLTYFIGRIVEGIDKAPEGFTLMKIPASEYFVITYEWIPANVQFNHYGEYGNEQSFAYLEYPEIPNGYIRYEEAGSKVSFIEIDNFDTPDGSRIEIWIPIKKVEITE